MKEITNYNTLIFEDIKHINEYGQEFWYGRDLLEVLQYSKWENFKKVIEKAKEACNNSDFFISDHFADVRKMVLLGSGAKREIEDIKLSRYACYLIVQNADARKKVVALGQTYFAVQTRKQEIEENFEDLSECKKRLAIRNELKEHNKNLVDTARISGVETNLDYAIFQNNGYMGLYGGLNARDIHTKKGLKKSQKILDHMGSTELAANLFRATQTEEKLRREKIRGKEKANQAHFEVGKKVRETIKDLGGTMPEDLPTPTKSIKQLEREEAKKLKAKNK
ncbi:DNA damage-inducible protein D [Clostridium perfringens]|nr:DNA damage-inducible protein D [Clostridium perfringens]EGT3600569.1 DNA damage-inducible protein D [Clostridium perfringens]MBS5919860.1 DNA damage-inducible protein D [Clostridium perfringens]MDU3845641.1 DNA damage-inducible protein D [Clostridium perfringens]